MLRLFSLPTGRARASDAKWQRGVHEPFEQKRGSFFFVRRWGVSGRSNGKPLKPQTAKQCQTVSCCEASATGICGEIRLCVWSGSRSSIIHFSFCHLLFLGKNYKFQGFWWANFPLHEKMRRRKGPRWDKVGLSRMRDEVGLRLTIGRGSKCIKCERNDNMGDRAVHNSLIILKCLLEGYKIDNLSNE